MREEYFLAIFVLIWVFGWALVWLRRRRDRETVAAKRREMLHQERLAALDKGVPPAEIPFLEEDLPEWVREEAERQRARWLLRCSLLLGLLAVGSGLGMCLGFYLSPDRGFHSMWTLGIIPLCGGFGLLLFYRVASAAEPTK